LLVEDELAGPAEELQCAVEQFAENPRKRPSYPRRRSDNELALLHTECQDWKGKVLKNPIELRWLCRSVQQRKQSMVESQARKLVGLQLVAPNQPGRFVEPE